MKVSLIIPVYNEGSHLDTFFERLFAISFQFPVEYVIVDDCSSDSSWSIIEKIGTRADVSIFQQPHNAGKGSALHKGFALATGDIIVVQDADFEYDPEDLNELVAPILADKADVVYGSRFHKANPQVHRTFHYLVNRFLTLLSNIFSGLYLSDMETCYKVFRADVLQALELSAKRFGFEPEVTAKIAKLRLRILELPISYFPRGYGEGKKINWKDGVAAIWFILKFNLRPLDRQTLDQLPKKYLLTGSRLL